MLLRAQTSHNQTRLKLVFWNVATMKVPLAKHSSASTCNHCCGRLQAIVGVRYRRHNLRAPGETGTAFLAPIAGLSEREIKTLTRGESCKAKPPRFPYISGARFGSPEASFRAFAVNKGWKKLTRVKAIRLIELLPQKQQQTKRWGREKGRCTSLIHKRELQSSLCVSLEHNMFLGVFVAQQANRAWELGLADQISIVGQTELGKLTSRSMDALNLAANRQACL